MKHSNNRRRFCQKIMTSNIPTYEVRLLSDFNKDTNPEEKTLS
jgi:hypothetical protein